MGRVFLQFGAIRDSEACFQHVEAEAAMAEGKVTGLGGVRTEANPGGCRSKVLLNQGLLQFSKNNFVGARKLFLEAAEVERAAGSGGGAAGGAGSLDWAGEEGALLSDTNRALWWLSSLEVDNDVLMAAMNNLCLSLVYACDVREGVTTIEGLIREDPQSHMHSVVVFNLCTLYDLAFDIPTSAAKKRVLKGVAQRFSLDDIDPTSFKSSRTR
ncbi:unnamed protein product [Choristocarpus tenellus]